MYILQSSQLSMGDSILTYILPGFIKSKHQGGNSGNWFSLFYLKIYHYLCYNYPIHIPFMSH